MTTKAEREWMNKVAQLPCEVCGKLPVEVHHIDTGMGRKKNHMKTIPLCPECHRGKTGLGGMGRKAWVAKIGKTEAEMLERVKKKLEYGDWM